MRFRNENEAQSELHRASKAALIWMQPPYPEQLVRQEHWAAYFAEMAAHAAFYLRPDLKED